METWNRKPIDEVTFLDEEAQSFIASLDRYLAEQDDVDAALTQVIIRLTEFIGTEEGSIFLVEEPSGDLVLSYAAGAVGTEIVGLRLESGQGVVGWVIRFSEDLIIPYPGLDARFFEGVDERTGFSTRSILCGPIIVDGESIGAIEVLNKTVGTFDDDDLVVLRTISRRVAKIIPVIGS